MKVLVERQGRVAIIRLNRLEALNALNSEMMRKMVAAMQELDNDSEVGCWQRLAPLENG